MKQILFRAINLSSLGMLVLLTACSSGGDGGGNSGFVPPQISTQPVSISSANEDVVAQAAFEGSNGGAGLGSEALIFFETVSVTDGDTAVSNSSIYSVARKLLNASVDAKLQQAASASVAGVEFSGTEECAIRNELNQIIAGSGSESFQGDIAAGFDSEGMPNSITAGDHITSTFHNCDYGDGVVQNGSVSITFNSPINIVDLLSGSFSADVTFSFNNYSVASADAVVPDTEVLHGTVDISLAVNGASVTMSMSGDSLYVVLPDESVLLTNFSFDASTDGFSSTVDASFSIASTAIDGQISVVSHLETTGNNYPTVGYMNISGNNSQMNITVNNDGTTVNVTLTVNDVVQSPEYPKDVAWADLGIEVSNVF
jgi:hypothetical protein